MTFRLINLNIMVYDDWLLIGQKNTSVIDCNTFNIMIPIPYLKVFSVECLKGQFLVHSSFLLYINDLCNVSNIFDLILFADDNNISYSHKDNSHLTRKYIHAETLALLTKPLYFPNMKYLK